MCRHGAWARRSLKGWDPAGAHAFPRLHTKEAEVLKGKGKVHSTAVMNWEKEIHTFHPENTKSNAKMGKIKMASHSPNCRPPRNICQTGWNRPPHLARNSPWELQRLHSLLHVFGWKTQGAVQTPGRELARFFPDLLHRASPGVLPWC